MAVWDGTGMKRIFNLSRYPLPLLLATAGLFALSLAMLSIDLVGMTLANLDFLRRAGVMGLLDGGLLQLAELTAKGTLGLLCYFGFKLCEVELIHRYRNWHG